jgi:tetratricopeptide (TPR) repeat protein
MRRSVENTSAATDPCNDIPTRKLLCVVLIALTFSIFNFQFSIAQKFPERREARQGTKLYDRGDFAGAETRYRKALELNPELREAAFNLGGAMWRQERAQEAAAAWTAIAADSLAPVPMVSAASYNVGNVALAGQQLDAAIESYKAALRLRPDDMEAKYNLAYAQKLKQRQQDQNKDDQNDDKNDQNQNQDQNQNDQNQDQDQNDQNDDGQDDKQNDRNDQNEKNDPNGDGQNDRNDQGEPPPPQPQNGQGEPRIDPRAAEQMLDAMQAAEDDTREKVNAKEVQVGARSGKNW